MLDLTDWNGKKDIKSMTPEEVTEELAALGEKSFRAKQLYEWMHVKLAKGFDDMSSLSKGLREKLREIYSFTCASTLDGLERNLRPSEMLEQIYRIQALTGERVSNVVVMGSGEPLDNYDNVVRFLRLISHEKGLNISQRNLTISTCGLVPQIHRFAEEGLSVTLALSLHAPNDEVRKTLMPIANRYKLKDVLEACHYYYERTGRRLTFEYSLVQGVNDNLKEAKALSELIGDQHGHVNLIPVNPIKERDYVQSGKKAIQDFKGLLERNGIAFLPDCT